MSALNARDAYAAVGQLDPVHGLDEKTLHISPRHASGMAWIASPTPVTLGFSTSQYLQIYRHMAAMRYLEEALIGLSRKNLTIGKTLPAIGNEATAVGAAYALAKNDWLGLAIRDSGALLVRGISPNTILAECCGRMGGVTNGWDSGFHPGSRELRTMGINISHLGTVAAVMAGAAYTDRYRASEGLAAAFSGDGATSTGDIHEALNLASVLRIPFVLIVENNQWAFGTPNALEFSAPTLALRALGYGGEGYLVDGTNVLAVYDTVKRAALRAKEHAMCCIVEARTMRMLGHSLADPYETYVPKAQLDAWKAKDPIEQYRNVLLNSRLADAATLAAIEQCAKTDIAEAENFAVSSPFPDGSDVARVAAATTRPDIPDCADTPSEGERITYHAAISRVLKETLETHPHSFLIGEDIAYSGGAFKVTQGFAEKFDNLNRERFPADPHSYRGHRVIDAPISEAAMCEFAIGASWAGLTAIVEFQYADFSSEAFKAIVNLAASMPVRGMGPLRIVLRMPAGWTPGAGPYHSVNPESWFCSTPGLKIVAPITAYDAIGLFRSAIEDGNPVIYCEYKAHYRKRPETLPPELNVPIPKELYRIPIGKARTLKEGNMLTVISYGSQLFPVLDAVHAVEQGMGMQTAIEVIDLRSLIPFDADCIAQSVKKTGKVLVACEAPKTGCFGDTIVRYITEQPDIFHALDSPPMLIAAADTLVPASPTLEKAHLPTAEALESAIKKILAY